MRSLKLALVLILSANIYAADLSGFKKRFEFVKNDEGVLVAVRDKTIRTKFKFSEYINYIKNSILNEQELMRSSGVNGSYDGEVEELFNVGHGFIGHTYKTQQNIKRVVTSMRSLENVDFVKVFENPAFQKLLSEYSEKLKDAFYYIDPMLIAKPDNARFYYRQNVTYKVVSWGLDQARKRFSTAPFLNTAFYVITEVEKLFRTRRHYHQNMLLHYIEHVDHRLLGLEKEEADLIMSSIFESRIQWMAFWESSKAQVNWDRYGIAMFYSNFRTATNRLRKFSSKYDSLNERLNYSFQEVSLGGERVIVNLVDKNHTFDASPAVSYSYDNPVKVKRLRGVLTIAGLGLSFVPLPAFIKENVDKFIKSYYKNQQVTEGALMAHFEMNSNEEMIEEIAKQYINPFAK